MYKIEFYVPFSHREIVKNALFSSGAGKIGQYEQCCWQIEGDGQFFPGDKSHPHIGEKGELETLKEWKVEMVCDDVCIKEAVSVLLEFHPYEEPAFHIVKNLDKSAFL